MNPCLNCGADVADDNPNLPRVSHCPQCTPTICESCGGICDWRSGALCSCWISFDGMSLADQKALFADDCDGPGLSLDRVTEQQQ